MTAVEDTIQDPEDQEGNENSMNAGTPNSSDDDDDCPSPKSLKSPESLASESDAILDPCKPLPDQQAVSQDGVIEVSESDHPSTLEDKLSSSVTVPLPGTGRQVNGCKKRKMYQPQQTTVKVMENGSTEEEEDEMMDEMQVIYLLSSLLLFGFFCFVACFSSG